MRRFKKMIIWLMTVLILGGALWFLKFAKHDPLNIDLSQANKDYWGVTFSRKLCDEVGLDWKETYQAIINDLGVKYIRMPIYWDDVEIKDDYFDFNDYDYLFREGKKQGVKFIANIGWRLPRWPECHSPQWLKDLKKEEIEEESLEIIAQLVNHYKDHEEIIIWQIENEPLLNSFGICPDGDEDFLRKEVDLVKSLDDRKILISASGELSTWRREASLADVLGTTMYRVVWDKWFGYFRYPLPSWFYRFKANLLGIKKDDIIVSELQAEPWVPNGTLADLKPNESNKSFNLKQFKANLQYAINADLNQAYLWGAEWWYLRKINGDSEYWDLAKTLFNK